MDIGFFELALQTVALIVMVDVIASWFVPNPEAFPRSFTSAISGPLCAPFRALLKPERFGGIDLSPLMVFLVLRLAASALALAAAPS